MLRLVALIAGFSALDLSVLGVAAAVAQADGGAFLAKLSVNHSGEPSGSASEEDWGLRRLGAFDYGDVEEAPGDAADDDLQGGAESRRLAAREVGSQTELQQQGVAVEQHQVKDPEDAVNLEHRRVLRTMQKLPPVKGIKTFILAALVMSLGVFFINRGLQIDFESGSKEDDFIAQVIVRIGLGVSGVGFLLSLIALPRLAMSGIRRRKWVRTAQQAILDYQKEFQSAEGGGVEGEPASSLGR